MSGRICKRGNNGEQAARTAGMRAKTGERWDFEIAELRARKLRRLAASCLIIAALFWIPVFWLLW